MGAKNTWLQARKRRKQIILRLKKILGGSAIAALIVGPLIYFGVAAQETAQIIEGDLRDQGLMEAQRAPATRTSEAPIEFSEQVEVRKPVKRDDIGVEVKQAKVPEKLRQPETAEMLTAEPLAEEITNKIASEFRGVKEEMTIQQLEFRADGLSEKSIILNNVTIDTGPAQIKSQKDASGVAMTTLQKYIKSLEESDKIAVLRDTEKLDQVLQPDAMVIYSVANNNGKWYVEFKQYHNMLPVFDGNAKLIFTETKKLLVLTDNIRRNLPSPDEFKVGTAVAQESTKELFEWDDEFDRVQYINKGYYKEKPIYKVEADAHNPLGRWDVYVNGVDGSVEGYVTNIRLQDDAPAAPAPAPAAEPAPAPAAEPTPEPVADPALSDEPAPSDEPADEPTDETVPVDDDEQPIADETAEPTADEPALSDEPTDQDEPADEPAPTDESATPEPGIELPATPEPEITLLQTLLSQVFGIIYPKTPNDLQETQPFANQYVYINERRLTTDEQGYFDNPGMSWYSLFLEGPYVTVMDGDATANIDIVDQTPEDPFTWDENSASLAAINTFYHINKIRQWAADNLEYEINYAIPVTVNSQLVDQYLMGCGAWFDTRDKSIEIGRGGYEGEIDGVRSPCMNDLNYALSSDIIYHEYAHNIVESITHLPNIKGAESAALGEGLADYFAATINDDPLWGDVITVRTRNLQNMLTYQDDMTGTAHYDGQIFSGALWDLRQAIGAEKTDKLVYNTLYQGRLHFETFMYGMIIEDDDNEDFSDGTPHLAEILTAFEKHGIGPGVENFTGLPISPEDWSELLEEELPEGEEDPLLGAWSGTGCSLSGTYPNQVLTVSNGSNCNFYGTGSGAGYSYSNPYSLHSINVYNSNSIFVIGPLWGTDQGHISVQNDVQVYNGGSIQMLNTTSSLRVSGVTAVYRTTSGSAQGFISAAPSTSAGTSNLGTVRIGINLSNTTQYGGYINWSRGVLQASYVTIRSLNTTSEDSYMSVNASGGSFTLANTLTMSQHSYFAVNGGTTTISTAITLPNTTSIRATGGSLTLSNTLTLSTSAYLAVSGSGSLTLSQALTLPNSTSIRVSGGTLTSGNITLNTSSYLQMTGGTTNPASVSCNSQGRTGGNIDLDGTANFTPSNLLLYNACEFNNTGNVSYPTVVGSNLILRNTSQIDNNSGTIRVLNYAMLGNGIGHLTKVYNSGNFWVGWNGTGSEGTTTNALYVYNNSEFTNETGGSVVVDPNGTLNSGGYSTDGFIDIYSNSTTSTDTPFFENYGTVKAASTKINRQDTATSFAAYFANRPSGKFEAPYSGTSFYGLDVGFNGSMVNRNTTASNFVVTKNMRLHGGVSHFAKFWNYGNAKIEGNLNIFEYAEIDNTPADATTDGQIDILGHLTANGKWKADTSSRGIKIYNRTAASKINIGSVGIADGDMSLNGYVEIDNYGDIDIYDDLITGYYGEPSSCNIMTYNRGQFLLTKSTTNKLSLNGDSDFYNIVTTTDQAGTVDVSYASSNDADGVIEIFEDSELRNNGVPLKKAYIKARRMLVGQSFTPIMVGGTVNNRAYGEIQISSDNLTNALEIYAGVFNNGYKVDTPIPESSYLGSTLYMAYGGIKVASVSGDESFLYSRNEATISSLTVGNYGNVYVFKGTFVSDICNVYGSDGATTPEEGTLTVAGQTWSEGDVTATCGDLYIGSTTEIPGKVELYHVLSSYKGILKSTNGSIFEDGTYPNSTVELDVGIRGKFDFDYTGGTIDLGSTVYNGGEVEVDSTGIFNAYNLSLYKNSNFRNNGAVTISNNLILQDSPTAGDINPRLYENYGQTTSYNIEINGDNSVLNHSTPLSSSIIVTNDLSITGGRLMLYPTTSGISVAGHTSVIFESGNVTYGEIENRGPFSTNTMYVTGYVQNGSSSYSNARMNILSTSGTEDMHIYQPGLVKNWGGTLNVGDTTGGQLKIEGAPHLTIPGAYSFAQLENRPTSGGAKGYINAYEIYDIIAGNIYNDDDASPAASEINIEDKLWTGDNSSPKSIYNYGTGVINVNSDGNGNGDVWLYDNTYWLNKTGSTLTAAGATGIMKVFGPLEGTTVDNYGTITTSKLWNGASGEYVGGTINNEAGGDIDVTSTAADAGNILGGTINLKSGSLGFDVAGTMTIQGNTIGASGKIDATDGTHLGRPKSTYGGLNVYYDGIYDTEDDVDVNGNLAIAGSSPFVGKFILRSGNPVNPTENESTLNVTGTTTIYGYGSLQNYSHRKTPGTPEGWITGGFVAGGQVNVNAGGTIQGMDTTTSFYLQGGLVNAGNALFTDDIKTTTITQTSGVLQMGQTDNVGISDITGKITISGGQFTTYNYANTPLSEPDGGFHDIEITGPDSTAYFANDDGGSALSCQSDIHGYLDILNDATVYVNCDSSTAVKVHAGSPGGNTQVEGTLVLNTNLTTETMTVGDGVSNSGTVTHDTVTSSGAEATTFVLLVTETLTVNSNGEMNVDGKANFWGFGGAGDRGGSYGGIGQYGISSSPFSHYGYMGTLDEQFGRCGITSEVGTVCEGDGGGRMTIGLGAFDGSHAGELILNSGGKITANGGSATTGGGSGGNIIIITDNTISGTGTISANGGNSNGTGTGTYSTAGGGGRIFIYHYAEDTFKPGVADFTGTISAVGGLGAATGKYAGTGTITKFWTSPWGNQNDGTIYVNAFGNPPDINNDNITNSTDVTTLGIPSPGVESVQAENNAWVNIVATSYLQQCVKDGFSSVSIGSPGAYMNRDHTPVLTTSCLFSPDPPRDLHINNSGIGAATEYEGESDDTQPHVTDLTPAVSAEHYDARLDSNDTYLSPAQDAIKYQLQISTDLSDLFDGTNGGSIVTNCNLDNQSFPLPGYVSANDDGTNTGRSMDIIIDEDCGNNLVTNTDYYWRIRFMEDTPGGLDDYWGLWSETNTFKIDSGGTIDLGSCSVGGTQFSLGTYDTGSTNPLTRNFYEDFCTFNTDATVQMKIQADKTKPLSIQDIGGTVYGTIFDMKPGDYDPTTGIDGKHPTGYEINEVGFYVKDHVLGTFTAQTSDAGVTYDTAYTYIPTLNPKTILISYGGYNNETFNIYIGAFIHGLLNAADPTTEFPVNYCGENSQTEPCITRPGIDGNPSYPLGPYKSVFRITATPTP